MESTVAKKRIKLLKIFEINGKNTEKLEKLCYCAAIRWLQMLCPTKKKPNTRVWKRKTSSLDGCRVASFSKGDPSASANKIQKEFEIPVSVVTIRRRLLEKKLFARSPRKVPLLTKKQAAPRLKYAQEHKGANIVDGRK